MAKAGQMAKSKVDRKVHLFPGLEKGETGYLLNSNNWLDLLPWITGELPHKTVDGTLAATKTSLKE